MEEWQVKSILQNHFPDIGKKGKYAISLKRATVLANAVLRGEDGLSVLKHAETLDFMKAKEIQRTFQNLSGGRSVQKYKVRMKSGEEFVFETHYHLDSFGNNGWEGLSMWFDKLTILKHNGKPCGEESKVCLFLAENLDKAFLELNKS